MGVRDMASGEEVKDMASEIIENGTWNLTAIDHILDSSFRNEILNIMPPEFSQATDHPT